MPIVENPPLARGLYTAAEVGQEIPAEFYRAVAEVLAYIYRLMGRRRVELTGVERNVEERSRRAADAAACVNLQTLGEMAVPIGVLAIVIAMITPLAGVPAGLPDRRRTSCCRSSC